MGLQLTVEMCHNMFSYYNHHVIVLTQRAVYHFERNGKCKVISKAVKMFVYIIELNYDIYKKFVLIYSM